jgi:hypothetical protein
MKPIQPSLILLVVCLVFFYFRWLRSRLADRLAILALASVSVTLICAPQIATTIANYCGVGRGADLVFYIGAFVLGFVSLVLYARLRTLEIRLTAIIRANAIAGAVEPSAVSNLSEHCLRTQRTVATQSPLTHVA